MSRIFSLFLLSALLLPVTTDANLSQVTVRPFLVDTVLVPRESATEQIRLNNPQPNRKAIVYATVNEITIGSDGEIKEFVSPVMTDRTNTVTSWIEITRARIEIPPGEQVEVPLKITVHPFAEPGEYHAFIGFAETSKRFQAEAQSLRGESDGVLVKVTVPDERVDSMRIISMVVDRFITDPENQTVKVTVENPGELASVPVGELIFYNSRGVEVAAAPVNESLSQLAPGERETFSVKVPFNDDLGRFKANLNLRYGTNQQANLFDTTTFFMIPTWYLFVIGVAVLILLSLFIILFKRALSTSAVDEHGDEVVMFVRDGHDPRPQEHDIDLTTRK